eukprot:jgi/Tetstr1/437818/TSEL_026458.t1
MRAEHHPYVVRGAEVVAHATAFDEDNTHAWSRATFGEDWATVTLNGVVRTVSGTVAVVRWEDGDEDTCTFDAMELRGETLRAAQASLAQPRSPSRRGGTGGEAGGGASSGAEGGAASSEDEPLFNYAARGRAPGADPSPSPARSSPSPAASDDSHDSTASAGSDSDSDTSPPRAGAGRGSTAGGRACDRDGVAARGRGGRGSRGSRGSRGRGRGRSAAPLTTEVGEHIVEDTDSEVEEEAEADADSPAAALKLHGHTEKPVLDYFSACFPAGLVEDIAASMTRRGRELGYGALWEVLRARYRSDSSGGREGSTVPAAPRRRGLGGGAAAAAGPSRAMSAKGSPAGKHAAALGRSASTPASPAEKMGRPQRHQLIVQDMVFALRLGTHDERVEAAVVLGGLATLSDGHRMRIMQAGALDALLECTDIFQDFVLPRYALRTLADLSVNESVRQEVKNRGGLPKLVDVARRLVLSIEQMPALLENEQVPLVAQAITAALSAQSNNDSSKVIIREMQGIELLISALKLFTSSEEVQLEVCTALANMSLDPASRAKITGAKGVEAICVVLQDGPPSKVVLSSMRALAHVSRIDQAAESFTAEQIEAVVRCMTDRPDREVNMWAAQVLSNLAAHKPARPLIEKCGGTKALCALLVAGNGTLKRSTSWVVTALSRLVSNAATKITIQKEQAVKPAVWLLGNIMSNMGNAAIPEVLHLLSAMCAIEACQVEIHDTHGTQLMISLAGSTFPKLMKSALYTLSMLADYPEVRKTISADQSTMTVLFSHMQNNADVCSLAAAIIAKCTKSADCAERLATEEVMSVIFNITTYGLDDKTAAWAANSILNMCVKLGDRLVEKCPGVVVNIMSTLVKDTSNDVRVWLMGALAELSQNDNCASAIVDMSGITLMAQYISTSTDGQCIEMAAKVLRNLAAKGDPRGEFNSQGAIRPMVNLLRLSQENNDLENTRNVVTCMEHLSESPDNGCALRQSGAIPLLVYLLGNQVGAAFVDLESEAAATLAHLAQHDPGSLNIIRQAGAVPKLLAMLSIANHGINAYNIPTAVTKAVECLRAVCEDNDLNRKAVLNSSNFYAVEALRMRELELQSTIISDTVAPLLEALRLNQDWLKDTPRPLPRRRNTKNFIARPESDSPDHAPVGNGSVMQDTSDRGVRGCGPPVGGPPLGGPPLGGAAKKEVSWKSGQMAAAAEASVYDEEPVEKKIVFTNTFSTRSPVPPASGPIAALLQELGKPPPNDSNQNGGGQGRKPTRVDSFPVLDDAADERAYSNSYATTEARSETSQASLDYFLAQQCAQNLLD